MGRSNEDRNPVERMKFYVTNHPAVAIATLLATAIIGLSTFTDAIQNLWKAASDLSSPSPLARISVEHEDNGIAVLRFRFFNIPENRNVDRIDLALDRHKPEVGVQGSPSEQVKPLRLDAQIVSPKLLNEDDPSISVEIRLMETVGEPYSLAEIPLYWQRKDSSIALRITPAFFDAHDQPIDFDVDPVSVVAKLTNYSTVRFSEAGQPSNALDAAIEMAQGANTLAEMEAAAEEKRFQDPFVREGLWYLAAFASWPEQFQVDTTLQEKVLKTVLFATFLELAVNRRSWPEDEPLSGIGPTSLKALDDKTSLAPAGSPRRSLFSRKPEFRKDLRHGFYHYLRFDLHGTGKRVVFERSDIPLPDLNWGYNYRMEDLPATDPATSAVQARSYSFPLGALNHFVIAAKASMSLSVIGEAFPYAKYANLILANSIYAASLMEGNGHSAVSFSRTAIHPMTDALDGLRLSSPNFGRLLSASVLEPRLTAMNFFGRKLHVAARRYSRAAGRMDREDAYLLYGHWGSAMAALGLEDEESAPAHLEAVLGSVSDDSPTHEQYRYMIGALFEIYDKESLVGKTLSAHSERIRGWGSLPVEEDRRYRMNLDLGRILWTIGDFREAARLFVREIRRLPDDRTSVYERHYLNELGAFAEDVFAMLSWRISFEDGREGDFAPRTKEEFIWLQDFAPTWLDLALNRGSGRPYGAVSPEEDRVTCLEAYGAGVGHERVIEVLGLLAEAVPELPRPHAPESRQIPGGGLVPWAMEQESLGNFEPLLKLAWVEWFHLPFRALLEPDFDLPEWTYQPLSVDNAANAQDVADIAERLSPTTRQVANAFLEIRRLLADRYGR